MLHKEAEERQRKHGGTAPGRPAQTLVTESTQVITPNGPDAPKGAARTIASKAVGVSGYVVQRAVTVKRPIGECPESPTARDHTVHAFSRSALPAEREKVGEPC